MPRVLNYFSLLAMLLLGACATAPSGPSVFALPGTGKSFDQFRADDAMCRQYAADQLDGKTPGQAAGESVARSAAVGTAIGAVVGGALDGHRGAAGGAGTGLLIGSLAGAGAADAAVYNAQRRYDASYEQCMYAKGHRIPVSGRFTANPRTSSPPPPPSGTPPPPPG